MRPHKHILRAQFAEAMREEKTPLPILVHELIVEILSWLPVKSLLPFRCVCKSWMSLISDPHFVKLHLHRSATCADLDHRRLLLEGIHIHLNLLDCKNFYDISWTLRSVLDNPPLSMAEHDICYRLKEKHMILCSCNGLICLVSDEEWEKSPSVRLWNPATRLTSNMTMF